VGLEARKHLERAAYLNFAPIQYKSTEFAMEYYAEVGVGGPKDLPSARAGVCCASSMIYIKHRTRPGITHMETHSGLTAFHRPSTRTRRWARNHIITIVSTVRPVQKAHHYALVVV
jgi:hypothetical protein